MLAIAGGKGGTGKTTTALGVARALAATGQAPLVVDTDVDMPDLHLRAATDRTPGIDSVATGRDPRTVSHRSQRVPGVDVLPCCEATNEAVESALERLSNTPGPVIIDCPAGAGPDAASPLRAATETVLVSTPDEQSLRDTAKTAAMARELDASPVVTVLSRTSERVDPAPLLGCSETVTIPNMSKPPLESQESRFRYREVVSCLNKRNI